MKNFLSLLLLLLFAADLNAQVNVEEELNSARMLVEDEKYDDALNHINAALEVEQDNPELLLLAAKSNLGKREYETANNYLNDLLHLESKFQEAAVALMSDYHYYTGSRRIAIKYLEGELTKNEKSDLLYNKLAQWHLLGQDYEAVEETLGKAIKMNERYVDHHLLLAEAMIGKHRRCQAALCMYYALMMDPNHEGADELPEKILTTLTGSVVKTGDKNITIYVPPNIEGDPFATTEIVMSVIASMELTDNFDDKTASKKPIEDRFKHYTSTLMLSCRNELYPTNKRGKPKKRKKRLPVLEGIFWDTYVPMLVGIESSEHYDTWCNYIRQASSDEYKEWVKKNKSDVTAMLSWLSTFDPPEPLK